MAYEMPLGGGIHRISSGSLTATPARRLPSAARVDDYLGPLNPQAKEDPGKMYAGSGG
jgi:hypothetical protein